MNNIERIKTILLVEDEHIISILTSMMIKKWGYNVLTVNCGAEAVEIVSEHKSIIDLILMDIDLGYGIDGTEAAEQILSLCNIPIVFYTSHSEPEVIEKIKRITKYGYIGKNSENIVLKSLIEMALERF